MTNNTKIGLSLAGVIVLSIYFLTADNEIKVVENSQPTIKLDNQPKTIAEAWKSEIKKIPTPEELANTIKNEVTNDDADEEAKPEIKLDYAYIHEEIGKIRLSEDGQVIIDEQTLAALRQAFPSRKLVLTEDMLTELQDILKEGLPSPAGEQSAEIISNFYEYLVAKKEMDQIYRDIASNNSDHDQILSEAKALRELYLGKEVSDKLFATEDKNAQLMIKAFEIASNKNLTAEEKAEKREELNRSYIEDEINNWNERYQAYQTELNTIKASALSNENLSSAIEELKSKHFTIEEQTKISNAYISLE